jgi:hypothetical protein
VTVGDVVQPSLRDALLAVRSGDLLRLGAGVFHLTETLRIPAGVSLVGAGAHGTVLSASGLAVGVSIEGGGSQPVTTIKDVTVAGASIGVQVTGSQDALVQNVILRDNLVAGLEVSAGAAARLVNGTLTRNQHGVRGYGGVQVRNSLIVGNDVGLWAAVPDLVSSSYNDVADNRIASYQSVSPGERDLATSVSFRDAAGGDFRLSGMQPTTDRGDPADDFSREPTPNGDRINLGAFGNTDEAELSSAAPPESSAADGGMMPPADATHDTASDTIVTPPPKQDDGGCSCAQTRVRTEGTGVTGLFLLSVTVFLVLRARRRRAIV